MVFLAVVSQGMVFLAVSQGMGILLAVWSQTQLCQEWERPLAQARHGSSCRSSD